MHIKFKQKLQDGQIHYWGFVANGNFVAPNFSNGIGEAIKNSQQFIGLQDKNGVDIYRGDVLVDESGATGEVVWLESRGGWAVSTEAGYFYPHTYGKYQLKNTEVVKEGQN